MDFKKKIERLLTYVQEKTILSNYIFLSMGKSNMRAQVIRLKNSQYIEGMILRECRKFKTNFGTLPKWIKIDIIKDIERIQFESLKKEMESVRRNYIDFGISFDSDFILSFLPEEINANAFIRPNKDTKELFLSEVNINTYIDKYKFPKKNKMRNRKYRHHYYINKEIIKFNTESFILDDGDIFELHNKGYKKGLRTVKNQHDEIDKLIETSTYYLKEQIQIDGKYNYGYFSHFDKKINFYNNLRHSSSTYSLIEGLSYLEQDILAAKKPIQYIINNYLYEKNGVGYVFDDSNDINEIKLGQNAAFVFAVCEYLKYHPEETEFLKAAQKAALGILSMIDPNEGETTHVLSYPSLEISQKFRVIYYDGEAALALLRLYKIDQNEQWLIIVKLLFEKFITQEYWKYHDHWLGYCTNELVQIVNDKRYYEFGIKNVSGYLDFIKERETTFPTFLEMLMATYHLIQKAKTEGYTDLVKKHIDEEKLIEVIHARADYQRLGYFYPEVAMYFKNPQRILGSFFIKHHGYRVRIDDIEHYISGLVQYQNVFKEKNYEEKVLN